MILDLEGSISKHRKIFKIFKLREYYIHFRNQYLDIRDFDFREFEVQRIYHHNFVQLTYKSIVQAYKTSDRPVTVDYHETVPFSSK